VKRRTRVTGKRKMQHHRASEGFTLIEMLVVLAIVGLTSALAYPELDRMMGSLRLKHTRADIIGALAAARAEALSTGIPVAMKIGSSGTDYILGNAPPQAIDQGLNLTGDPKQIRFFPDGSTSGGTLRIASSLRSATIFISRETGALREVSNEGN